MRKIDLFFNYKYTFRFLLASSMIDIVNTFTLPYLNKLVCYFPLRELIELNDARIYNYCFFFKFFFGIKPFFSRFKDISTFKKVQYSFSVQAILRKNDMFSVLFFFSNDVLPLMARRGFTLSLSYVNNCLRVIYILDKFNVFLVKKANLGLLNLHDPFTLKLYLIGKEFYFCKRLLYFFKT